MAELRVLGRYRSGHGSFEPGQLLQLNDEQAEFLLRDSPSSFARVAAPLSEPEPDLSAMSTETASGLVAPDRRARGGRRRRSE